MMYSPKRKASPAPAATQSFVLFAVKVLLVVVILFMLPKLVDSHFQSRKRRRRSEMEARILRTECYREKCAHLIPEEALNCVFECVSSTCYSNVYASDPLEDGEVDVARAKAFDDCLKEEMRSSRSRRASEEFLKRLDE